MRGRVLQPPRPCARQASSDLIGLEIAAPVETDNCTGACMKSIARMISVLTKRLG